MFELLDNWHAAVTLLSLALTVPTIVGALVVVFLWFSSAKKAVRNNGNRTAVQWLVLGVIISFFGSIADNVYWGFAWAANYIDHPSTEAWFRYGVYSNAPFRQAATMLAALCHIRAAVAVDSPLFRWTLVSSWIATVGFVIILWGLRQ